ncbi:MAG: amidohydrolase family protein [Gemmataceae bacterium]
MRLSINACLAIMVMMTWFGIFASAQHTWQRPAAPMKRADVEKLIGPVETKRFSQPRHIVWVWGYDRNHRPGNHDYTRVRDLMVRLLKEVPGVSIETAYLFPTQEQLQRSDLVVMYLHLPPLDEEHYSLLDTYLKGGGGLVAIHETMIQRPKSRGQQWAERLGLAWFEGKSEWGALFTDITVDNTHSIFENFPKRVSLVDEFYWHLTPATKKGSAILARAPVGPSGRSRGPVKKTRLGKKLYPVCWTMQFGKGRIFCTLPGHNMFLFNDPKFRIILLRGLAWAMNEKPDVLMPLVFVGIEKNSLVGSTDDMRDWIDKPRTLMDEGLPNDSKSDVINTKTNARLGITVKKPIKVKHIIDSHIHLYDPRRPKGIPWPPRNDKVLYKPHLPKDFKRVAKPAGVTGVIIAEASDRLEDNRWVLDLVKRDDFFVALVGNIDPYRKDFGKQLKQLKQDPRFVGIRARIQNKKINYRDPQVLANFRLLAKANLTLDILMNGEGVETIQEMDRLARSIPKLRIVVNHVLGYNIDGKQPGKKWIAAAKKLAKNSNVYVKVSGLYQRCTIQPATRELKHYRPLLDILWDSFGSERLIYGSNWPCTKRSGDYASFLKLVHSYFAEKGQAACEQYFWKNATKVYNLKTSASRK